MIPPWLSIYLHPLYLDESHLVRVDKLNLPKPGHKCWVSKQDLTLEMEIVTKKHDTPELCTRPQGILGKAQIWSA